MHDDIAQLAVDLQALIDRARSALEREQDVLDAVVGQLNERIEASERFLRAFGHIAPPSLPPHTQTHPRTAEEAFDTLSKQLAQTMGRG